MSMSDDLLSISKQMQQINYAFNKVIQPYRSTLWNYCLKLTGSPWDAEDLLQETLLKSFSSLSRVEQALNPKSYIFRIATNTWMDSIRKNKLETVEIHPENTYAEKSVSYSDLYDAIDTMVQVLPPKQTSVLLLVDIYNFTAKEVAEIIASTEGAVYSLLQRARNNMKKLHSQHNKEDELKHIPLSGEKKQVIKEYMDSFVNGDFQAIGTMLAEYATNEVVGRGLDIGKDQIRKNSMGDWASGGTKQNLSSSYIELWGKGAIVFTKETESGPVLWDITTVEINDNYIVKHRSYYFCKDLLLWAANKLQIKMDEDKDLYGYNW
ncbi:RNA polymerase sigma factor [Paenibacillus xylanilyticus]|uniref:RNA polymerase sigma factor n=1 Tax=Paenibacillus xylanilyticus TaxID=248903 RepID=A0A7Y6ERX8_9BACL|nr:RNA polymerase sigma factor [Paenibacillus xylanilyticus]NUU74377.1 RNA polymerase sigma factor [Paenibacillus xylanilyticus]